MPMKPMFRHAYLAAAIPALLILVGCTATTSRDSAPSSRESLAWPEIPADIESNKRFRVDAAASALRVLVAPAGSLARLGHHHVIGGPVLSGELWVGETVASDLVVDVDALQVDPHEWREAEGWEPLDQDAIDGTRRNLLGPEVLDVERFPEIEVRSVDVSGPDWQPDVIVRVRLRDVVSEHSIPVAVYRSDDRLTISGGFEVDQAQLGMTPFSAAGGALRVAERLQVRFRIVARPDPRPGTG